MKARKILIVLSRAQFCDRIGKNQRIEEDVGHGHFFIRHMAFGRLTYIFDAEGDGVFKASRISPSAHGNRFGRCPRMLFEQTQQGGNKFGIPRDIMPLRVVRLTAAESEYTHRRIKF